jgi:acyl transferase domain-containing protein
LANKTLVDDYYATIAGSSVNQNGRRAQVITAPHPEAQEELIVAACQDAGIRPQEIAYVECHGTGTKIGDPIEISAIRNTVAKSRKETCYLGSVKSNIGHLESAAGIAGLIKSVSALNHGMIPPNLQFSQPNQYIDFKSTPIQGGHASDTHRSYSRCRRQQLRLWRHQRPHRHQRRARRRPQTDPAAADPF